MSWENLRGAFIFVLIGILAGLFLFGFILFLAVIIAVVLLLFLGFYLYIKLKLWWRRKHPPKVLETPEDYL